MLKHTGKTGRPLALTKQNGVTLIELLIAMVISVVASSAMVMLMANTLGSGTRTIAMTHLTQDMRTAMQIISRDLRRANYISPLDARTCYANVDCLVDLGYQNNVGLIAISDDSDCLSYWLDRDLSSSFESTDIGAFRLTVTGGIGSIQMLTSYTSMGSNNCPTGTWAEITDPEIIDVQSFEVDDANTYVESISSSGSTQTVQKIRLLISAELINSGNYTISREIGDEIRIRNNFTTL